MASVAVAAALCGLLSCATPAPTGPASACAQRGIAIDRNFERGAFAACQITGPAAAILDIRPETGASNDSPWYAFRLRAERPQTVAVTLRYHDGHHRYWPKWSRDGARWESLPPTAVTVSEDGREALVSLTAGREPLLVAAQPLETAAQAVAKARATLQPAHFVERVIGTSAEGRPITAFEHTAGPGAPLAVFIARQHPPETTGGAAFEAFIARIAATDASATAFRASTAILVIPLMNPDGFVRGHWRGNAAGKDINRDWGGFASPEVGAAAKRIEALAAGHPLAVLIDFHSTQRDVIYAAPAGSEPCGVADALLAKLQVRLGPATPRVSPSHTVGGVTAKAWSLDRFGVAGLTWEVADEANLSVTAEVAAAAAEAMMQAMAERGRNSCGTSSK